MALDGTLLRRFAFLMSDRKTVNGIHSIVMGYQIILNTKYQLPYRTSVYRL